MSHDFTLGLDLGSVSLDAVVLDDAGHVVWSSYKRVHGRSPQAVAALCREVVDGFARPHGVTSFSGALAAGSGKEIVAQALGVGVVNEIVAHGTAAARLAGGRASVIEIGGQDSKFILVDEHGPHDYAMNELCAAGTGAFLDVQAERLGITIEELSAMAAKAAHVPSVAGRCSVFAKSDIIHLQQRGTPVDEIVAGLCFALARNFMATLIRGRTVVRPVVFQGGVALNDGVIRAFRELLGLKEHEIIRPPRPDLMGAMGAAWLARERPEALPVERLDAAGSNAVPIPTSPSLTGWKLEQAGEQQRASLEVTHAVQTFPDGPLSLGIDVGSVSTDAVVMDERGQAVAHAYLFTAGRPVQAVQRALAFLEERVPLERVTAVGTTGSGRRLAGHLVGADVVVDEITAQARGARLAIADADTVIEIGGQDAKFIRLDGQGFVQEFEMNRACSAGTGSFIQEQAARLDVDLRKDFARLANDADEPTPLASRCTVFMESDLVHHVQQGAPLPRLLKGIAHAVVDNYMDRVAQHRKPGNKVVLQGGVANNDAVVQAFAERLAPSEVVVHPQPGLSGALGTAHLALEASRQPGFKTAFRGFSLTTDLQLSTFGCTSCENRCEVNVFTADHGRFHFGDLCGRYSEALTGGAAGTDHTQLKETMLRNLVGASTGQESVGVPEALLFREFFPFWFAFFDALHIKLVTSGPTSSTKLHAGLARLPAETCLPAKVLFGHVAQLKELGVTTVLLPAITRLGDGLACPYVQHASAMVSAVFPDLAVWSTGLVPGLSGRDRDLLLDELTGKLKRDRDVLEKAYVLAEESHRLSRHAWVVEPTSNRPVAVLLGKPYNAGDRFLNLALPAKLARAGFDVLLTEQLFPEIDTPLSEDGEQITWGFSRRMLRVATAIKDRPGCFAVIVGNFGCGPDSFSVPLMEEILGDQPSLFLELDEHRADAGLDTRVEAFAQRVRRWMDTHPVQARKTPEPLPPALEDKPGLLDRIRLAARSTSEDKPGLWERFKERNLSTPTPKRSEYIIPYFSEHAHAFAGALRAELNVARVLPPPTREVLEAGIETCGGKQCHPFLSVAGDIIMLARSGGLPEDSTYLFPVSGGSCLITQYIPTIRRVLNAAGRQDVEVLGCRSGAFLERFGPSFMLNLGRGLLGVEYLQRLQFELRPYEVTRGSVDRAYERARDLLLQGQVAGRVHEALTEAMGLLERVPTRNRGSKPVIGIAGDVYTRVNPVANGNLFAVLEELGCEVWLSPTVIDVALMKSEATPRGSRYQELRDTTFSWATSVLKNMEMWQVQRTFKGVVRNLSEPDQEAVAEYLRGLLPVGSDPLLMLNVAKHVDFARKRVDGILNVFCLNCMVGTSTAAVYPALAEKTGHTPMMSLVYDGLGTTHARNRIEAFVHRVNRARQRSRDVAVEASPAQ